MELGQMIFENDGPYECQYTVERGLYQAAFEPLWPLVDPYNYGAGRAAFENEVFRVFPYYWGDCTCGFEDRESRWSNDNPHHTGCWQERFRRATHNLDFRDGEKWALENGWPVENGNPRPGMAVYCDCGVEQQWQKWRAENDHSEECPTIQPNFHYKPTDFMISWYKYPFRSAYVNREMSAEDLVKIVRHCVSSIKEG
jgi:hypothetical protein